MMFIRMSKRTITKILLWSSLILAVFSLSYGLAQMAVVSDASKRLGSSIPQSQTPYDTNDINQNLEQTERDSESFNSLIKSLGPKKQNQ